MIIGAHCLIIVIIFMKKKIQKLNIILNIKYQNLSQVEA